MIDSGRNIYWIAGRTVMAENSNKTMLVQTLKVSPVDYNLDWRK
jgi:hypothetical protein